MPTKIEKDKDKTEWYQGERKMIRGKLQKLGGRDKKKKTAIYYGNMENIK